MNGTARIIVSAIVLAAVAVFVARSFGGVTETRSTVGNIEKVTLTWTTNGGASDYVRGSIERTVLTVNGATQATVSVTLKDENGIDLLGGLATAVPTNSATQFVIVTNGMTFAVNDKLTLAVVNGAAASTGSAVLYVRP